MGCIVNLLPKIGWTDISVDEALELGLDQPARWQWQIWRIEWLGFGFTVWARAKGVIA